MDVTATIAGVRWRVDLLNSADISIAVRPFLDGASQTSAFGLPPSSATFACSVDGGASVNCPIVRLCAHSGGTHTECVGHALPGAVTLRDVDISRQSGLMPALLVTVRPAPLRDSGDAYAPGAPDDAVVGLRALQEGLAALAAAAPQGFSAAALGCLPGGALVLRTPPAPFKGAGRWTGTNPPYLTPELMRFVLALGVQHLLVDLPSVDREDDGGHLLAHRAWWGLPARGAEGEGGGGGGGGGGLSTRTITEMILADERLADGPYMLNLQVAPLDLDAAPSRPVLYPLLRA